MGTAIALFVLGASVSQASPHLTGCAEDVVQEASLADALSVHGWTPSSTLAIDVPDCSKPTTVALEVTLQTGEVRTATVSLEDVVPAFRARTLAHLAQDLAKRTFESVQTRDAQPEATRPAPDPTNRDVEKPRSIKALESATSPPDVSISSDWRPVSSHRRHDLSFGLGSILRPTARDGHINFAPQLVFHFATDLWAGVRIRTGVMFEYGAGSEHQQFGVRLLARPSLHFQLQRFLFEVGPEYRVGLVHLAGNGNVGGSAFTRPIHGVAAALRGQRQLGDRLNFWIEVVGGHEFGVEGLALSRVVFSTHGAFLLTNVGLSVYFE